MAGEHRLDGRVVEPGAGDDRVRKAGPPDDLLDPARLADRIARVPLGLDVHCLDHVVPGGVPEVVRRQVVAPERPIVAVAERHRRLVAEPRQVVAPEVPEMLMGVDDRQVGHGLIAWI
jgi:hypothetical protein